MLSQVSLSKTNLLFVLICLVNPLVFVMRVRDWVGFSLKMKRKFRDDLLFEIAQIFPHQLVFEESGKIYMKAVVDEEVVSVESLTALTDLESLADGHKRLKGYSQEDLLQEATAFSGKRYFRSENRTACYILIN